MPVEDHHFIKRLMSYTNARLTGWGKILVASAFLGAGAASPGTHISAFLLPSFVIALLLTALFFSYFYRPNHISARRILPAPPAAGSIASYTVLLKNTGTKPLRNIAVFESTLPYGLYSAPRETQANNIIEWLHPGEERRLELFFRAPRRGVFELGDLMVGSSFPLGVSLKPVPISAKERFVVYPPFNAPADVHVPPQRLLRSGGVIESSQAGDSNEFLSTREYRTGDRLRDVHWPSTARAGKLIIKEYIEAYSLRAALVLDTHWPRGKKPVDFEARVSLCAGLAAALERKDCVVDLFTTDEKLESSTFGRSLDNLDHVLELLSCLEGDVAVDLSRLSAQISRELAAYSSLFVLLADWDAPRREFIESLKITGAALRVFVVRRGRTTLAADELVTVIDSKKIDDVII